MRKNIVAGNWKMNTTVPEGIELAKAVVAKSSEVPASVKLIIAPPFTHLVPVAEVVKGSVVGLSAQNCADKEKGAYTGEVSVSMLASAGCEIVRLAVLNKDAAAAIKDIVAKSPVPLVADIHFDYRLALTCIKNGIHALRINPGNIGKKEIIGNNSYSNMYRELHI